ncbi:DNA cytosine methyltransferase [Paenibacillus sp. Aloe-11]|uniref:DNA cytosine methyltransferase n=1 Tax=Paenibacillus sp. Aloe-11 TaxID=1050222 RepID=UPI00024F074B|nr:DNA cytosine methyltransferase [Paenibacillus sp. Aloe-11]EHS59022.1 site-specific DNA-methyltransferase, putative [Paenibacillus sp. Aloe-11]
MTYPVISLFSGAGFLDLGFTETHAFSILWGTELIKDFAQSNNYNMRQRYGHLDRVITADVTQIDPLKDIPKGAVGIIGGPPCQDYSIGNANSPGVEGDRGKLVWDFLDKIEKLQPDFFLFENVEALYKTKKHRVQALNPLIDKFNELGYEVQFKVLNTLNYGIPQDRSRVFIVGFRKYIPITLRQRGYETFKWPTPIYEDPKKTFVWPDVWEIGTEVNEADYIAKLQAPYELTIHSVIGNENELESLPNHTSFKPYSQRFFTVLEGDVKRKSFKRLHRFRYSPTVAYGNNEVHLHPTLPRRLTVREALRLQSVPDWFHFEEGTPLDKMFKMISNGVAYKLANLLAEEIKIVLDNYDHAIKERRELIRITNESMTKDSVTQPQKEQFA